MYTWSIRRFSGVPSILMQSCSRGNTGITSPAGTLPHSTDVSEHGAPAGLPLGGLSPSCPGTQAPGRQWGR